MILGFGLALLMAGLFMCNMDMFIPLTMDTFLIIQSLKWMGLGLGIIGFIVIAGRSYQTGAGIWLDLPSRNRVHSIHSGISGKRLDPNALFLTLKDIGLGILKSRKKVFKDTGGGFRICGHDVRRTHEKIGADIPEWLGQYIHQIKNKWKLKNDQDMIKTYEALQRIHDPVPGMGVLDQLKNIDIFEPVIKDQHACKQIENMTVDEVRNMTEYLFDGETVHMEDVENFIRLASPNELDTWIKKEMSLNELEKRTYREPSPPIDWNKWLPALGFFAITMMLGAIIFMSYFSKGG